MRTKDRVLDLFYYFIIGVMCTFSISLNSLTATVIDTDFGQILKLTILFMTIFYIWFYNKYSFSIGSALLIIGGGILFFMAPDSGTSESLSELIFVRVNGIISILMDASNYENEYDVLMQMLIILLISLVVSSTIKNWLGFYAITILGSITIIIPAYNKWEKSNFGRYIFLVCFVVLFLGKLNYYLTKPRDNEEGNNYGYSLFILPLVLIVMIGSTYLPTFSLDDASILDEINAKGNSFLKSGKKQHLLEQREKKQLGGPLVLGEESVMEVVVDERIYLKGAAMETYNGNAWLTNSSNSRRVIEAEGGEYNINPYPDGEYPRISNFQQDLGTEEKLITITMEEDIKTKRIYIPTFPKKLEMEKEQPTIFSDRNDVSWVSKNLAKSERYTQSYIGWDYSSQEFQNKLRNSRGAISDPEYLKEYLQIPNTVSERTVSLTREITSGALSNYDKLRAIESYLRENYPYTLETGQLPDGEDFVDYFLFTEKQGYCVYYATAMAIMARIEGIPTRYIEGYVMPADRNENGNYAVTNQQAHAWVEAFFPEFGWVRFEPTSAYSASNVTQFIPGLEEIPEQSVEEPVETPSPETEYEPTPEIKTSEDPELDTPEPQNNNAGGFIKFLLIILILAAVAGGVYFLINYRKKKFQQIESLPPKEKSGNYFIHIINIFDTMGYHIADNETFNDFTKRIQPELGVDISDLNEIFNKSIYSDVEVTPFESEKVEDVYTQLITQLNRQEKNKLKVIVQRYILMRY